MNYDKFKKINNTFYDEISGKSQDEHALVGQSELSHNLRLKKILEIGDLNNKTLLDVGCGLGSLYGHLRSNNVPAKYTGFDINKNMVEKARQKYPEIQNDFQLVDILEESKVFNFDYILSVGPLNLFIDQETNYAMTKGLLKKMFDNCTIGMALSMTSSLSQRKNDSTFYYDHLEIGKYISGFCNNFRIDHSYLPHDFTIFCYKENFYKKG